MTVRIEKADLIYALKKESYGNVIVLANKKSKELYAEKILWVFSEKKACFYETEGKYKIWFDKNYNVEFEKEFTMTEFHSGPCRDFCGNSFAVEIGGDSSYGKALSRFYWECLIPEIANGQNISKRKAWKKGYVLSTLFTTKYAGTYPAVDHEFHIRGRLAFGDEQSFSTVRQMMELTLETMTKDRSGKYRIPCSVQPNGKREYRVTRKSLDKKTKAVMFPLTGIIELCEEVYNYYCRTKDKDFVERNIETIEKGLERLESFTDENGRLYSDVYFEDQVMKDGATAQAQAFAVNALELMAKLETICRRNEKAEYYKNLSRKMKANYIKPLPEGYWDSENERYVDWIDRKGKVHDHIHLLSNALSVTYNFNTDERNEKIKKMISENDNIFQKFPSFVSAKIEDYTKSEIGDGGPYDLCAAGRYWCHDAKYRRKTGDFETIKNQLDAVMKMAQSESFQMGERYDMNYVFYNEGEDAKKLWHGSPMYYEYPNVFCDVLVHDYLGIRESEDCDVEISPCTNDARFKFESYGIECEISENEFVLRNISKHSKTFLIDLSALTGFEFKEKLILKSQEEFRKTKN